MRDALTLIGSAVFLGAWGAALLLAWVGPR